MIFKYPLDGINWDSNDVSVFIGYTGGDSRRFNLINIYSNLNDVRAQPAKIISNIGNASKSDRTILFHFKFFLTIIFILLK